MEWCLLQKQQIMVARIRNKLDRVFHPPSFSLCYVYLSIDLSLFSLRPICPHNASLKQNKKNNVAVATILLYPSTMKNEKFTLFAYNEYEAYIGIVATFVS